MVSVEPGDRFRFEVTLEHSLPPPRHHTLVVLVWYMRLARGHRKRSVQTASVKMERKRRIKCKKKKLERILWVDASLGLSRISRHRVCNAAQSYWKMEIPTYASPRVHTGPPSPPIFNFFFAWGRGKQTDPPVSSF